MGALTEGMVIDMIAAQRKAGDAHIKEARELLAQADRLILNGIRAGCTRQSDELAQAGFDASRLAGIIREYQSGGEGA